VRSRLSQALAACCEMLFPPACLLCGQLLSTKDGHAAFCRSCMSGISPVGSACCPLCAQAYPDAISRHCCGTCLKRPPPFSKVHVIGQYQGNLKVAIQRLKYRNQVTLAKPLGNFLGEVLTSHMQEFIPHCIVPVPLHPKRLKQRGYNQALELARPVARQMAIPLNNRLLQRTRNTPRQQGLSALERSQNMRNAFAVTAEALGLNILLIDDVMTTAETARECCRTLLKGGAAEVQVAVVGRA
jgi:ComF family protein